MDIPRKLNASAWNDKFEQLKQYKFKHGDCNMPQKYDKNQPLATWVKTQRTQFKLTKLSEERINILNTIGFNWGVSWNDKFEELKLYKSKHGDCDVPRKYDKNQPLATWVRNQRTQFKQSKMSEERINMLNTIGFNWRGVPIDEKKWNDKFEDLKQYKSKHGDCNVPRKYDKNQPLATWVHNQRTQFKQWKMSEERINMMNSIGFNWGVSTSVWTNKVIEDQKQMIDTLQKERQQFNKEIEKEKQENNALKQEIESLKKQIASFPSERSIDVKDVFDTQSEKEVLVDDFQDERSIDVNDVFDTQSEKEVLVDDFQEVALSIATKEDEDIDKCKIHMEKIKQELECPICFDPFEDPHIVPECCHRFCFRCIDTAIKESGKECPICRKRISSKRSLRRDELIGKISKLVSSDDKGGDENQVKLVTKTTKAKRSTKIKQREEEVEAMKEKLENQKKMLQQSASNVSQLEKRIAEKDEANLSLKGEIAAKEREINTLKQEIDILKLLEKRIAEKDKTNFSLKGIITAKEHENSALQQEIDMLKLQPSYSIGSKRSRDGNESSDNEDGYIIPKKRSKPHESAVSKFDINEALESENEDILKQLKKEKKNHSKTIKRLDGLWKKLKEAYHAFQR